MGIAPFDEAYNGFHVTGRIVPPTGPRSVFELKVYKDDEFIFQVEIMLPDFHLMWLASNGSNPEDELRDAGLQYTHGRIDLREFEKGKVYPYEFPLPSPTDSLSDDGIRQRLLKTYYDNFRDNPGSKSAHFDIDGICRVLEITRKNYLFNASALKTHRLLEDGPSLAGLIGNGGGLLTPSGLSYVEEGLPSDSTRRAVGTTARIVFFSWQSDLSPNTTRMLIQGALEKGAERIDIGQEIIVDYDTKGRPGSPDILWIILDKIKHADVFVCDLSFVDENKQRKLPNPNVLVELGYAMHALGMEKIIMVLNDAYGGVKQLPFDVGRFRIATYSLSENDSNFDQVSAKLQQDLEKKLREILTSDNAK